MRANNRTRPPSGSAPAIAAADATMVGVPRALAALNRVAPSCTVSVSPRVAPCRPVSRCGATGVVRSQGTLKSEIVQLERAHKRDSVDMEYLKNVVLKYTARSAVETAAAAKPNEGLYFGGIPRSGADRTGDVRYMELGDTEAIEPLLAEMLQMSDGGAF